MIYEIEYFPEALKDLEKLDNSVRRLVFKQLNKLAISPELGELLGNKAGFDLAGCRKMYVDNKRIRIVYRIFENKIIVEVVAIGERDGMDVYENAAERLK